MANAIVVFHIIIYDVFAMLHDEPDDERRCLALVVDHVLLRALRVGLGLRRGVWALAPDVSVHPADERGLRHAYAL